MDKIFSAVLVTCLSVMALAQEAVVNVVLHPAGSFKAKTTSVKGTIVRSGTDFKATNIVVDLSTLTTGISLRDEHTKKHLDVKTFPEAVLVSAQGHDGKGTGTIKIRGVQKDISGTYEVADNKLTAHFPLQLSDFKIDGIKYMGIGVDDKVTLDVTLPVSAEAPAVKK